MKVNEFINSGMSYKDIMNNNYVSISTKRKIADSAIGKSVDVIDGFVNINYFMINIYFDIAMLNEYTILEFDDDEVITEYDSLAKNGVFNDVFNAVKEDYLKAKEVLDQVLKGYLRSNSAEAFIMSFIRMLTNGLDSIADVLIEKLSTVDMSSLNNIDMDGLMETLNKLK